MNIPSRQNRNHLESEAGNAFDQCLKTRLANYAPAPPGDAWPKIKRHLPFSLLLQRQLPWAARTAAAIAAAILLSLGVNQPNYYLPITSPQFSSQLPPKPVADNLAPQQDFVLDMHQPALSQGYNSSAKFAAELEEQLLLQELFDSILEEETTLTDVFTDEELETALKPAERLPASTATASIITDIEIKIPLIIVEAHEIDEFIDMYNQYNHKVR